MQRQEGLACWPGCEKCTCGVIGMQLASDRVGRKESRTFGNRRSSHEILSHSLWNAPLDLILLLSTTQLRPVCGKSFSMLSLEHALRCQKCAVTSKQTDLPTAVSYLGKGLGKLKSQRDAYMMSDANCSYCSAEVSLREKFFNAEHGTRVLEWQKYMTCQRTDLPTAMSYQCNRLDYTIF